MRNKNLTRSVFLSLLVLLCPTINAFADDGAVTSSVDPLIILPFVLLLLAIAIVPLVNKRWWERRYPVVALALGGTTIAYYLFILRTPGPMVHTGIEYCSFFILIGSLFVVSGGIHIRIKGESTPLKNLALLSCGAIIANVFGTTGASMILIRPYLRANRRRLRPYHVVFFIFIVSNIGGALTPIGDPPLFLGYLRGIPFFWILASVWHIWLIVVGLVLLMFFLVDRWNFSRGSMRGEEGASSELLEEEKGSGLQNVFFLAVIVGSVFIEQPHFLR
jgi:Na+/H+ antiporter NhaD/arsenite permease-like protein